MSTENALMAVRLHLDTLAAAQGIQIAHEARDQALSLPRIEVADGPQKTETVTLSGVTRTQASIVVTIVTPWGDGTAQGERIKQAIIAGFPLHSLHGGGRIKSRPVCAPARRDGAERRMPLSLEIDVFSD